MYKIRMANTRGKTRIGWLDSAHSFAFGEYYDPEYENFYTLRVLNEDIVAPGEGFGLHPHRDMEIVTFVIDGTLAHEDSMGNRSQLKAGEVQWMSAGRGIQHSEMNGSKAQPVHFIQVWILPKVKGLAPQYDERRVLSATEVGAELLVSSDGASGSIAMNQDAEIYHVKVAPGDKFVFDVTEKRPIWIQNYAGTFSADSSIDVNPGDGLAIESEDRIEITAGADGASFLLFQLRNESR